MATVHEALNDENNQQQVDPMVNTNRLCYMHDSDSRVDDDSNLRSRAIKLLQNKEKTSPQSDPSSLSRGGAGGPGAVWRGECEDLAVVSWSRVDLSTLHSCDVASLHGIFMGFSSSSYQPGHLCTCTRSTTIPLSFHTAPSESTLPFRQTAHQSVG
eukprot:COSAG02_NODE_5640_length_4163_cov_5.349902_6_plen_156_part_00